MNETGSIFFGNRLSHCDKTIIVLFRKLVQEYGYEKIVTLNYTYDGKNLRGNEERCGRHLTLCIYRRRTV